MRPLHAQVAQLVEQRIENPRVGGSIPPLGTIFVWPNASLFEALKFEPTSLSRTTFKFDGANAKNYLRSCQSRPGQTIVYVLISHETRSLRVDHRPTDQRLCDAKPVANLEQKG
jgi:hypothetical protein